MASTRTFRFSLESGPLFFGKASSYRLWVDQNYQVICVDFDSSLHGTEPEAKELTSAILPLRFTEIDFFSSPLNGHGNRLLLSFSSTLLCIQLVEFNQMIKSSGKWPIDVVCVSRWKSMHFSCLRSRFFRSQNKKKSFLNYAN